MDRLDIWTEWIAAIPNMLYRRSSMQYKAKEVRFSATPIERIEVRQEALADAWAQAKAAKRQLSSANDPLMMAEVEERWQRLRRAISWLLPLSNE